MILNKRQLLTASAVLSAAIVAGCTRAIAGPAQTAAATTRPIGLQLYTVRELFAPDPMGTLEKVAEIGYKEVEYGGGGYDAMDHAALRKKMDELGLTSPSIHVGYDALGSKFDAQVAMAKTLGADTIIVPAVGDAQRTGPGWKEAVATMNRYAERLKKVGLDFAYHNHDFEFTQKPGGVSLFDTLLADGDPALMNIELDIYWAIVAGEDPKALIRRMPGRIYGYHVKDRTPAGEMTSVGKGVIDYADIFTLNDVAGVRHFYVENDESPAPYLPDIQTSFATMSALSF